MRALGSLRDPLAVSSIEPYLFDRETDVRLAAIEALSNLEYEQAAQALAGLLSDQDVIIRQQAVNALGEIGGEQALAYLAQGDDPWLRACAVNCGGERSTADLLRLVEARRTDPSPIVAETARRVLEGRPERSPMLSVVEKVMVLQNVDVFSEVSTSCQHSSRVTAAGTSVAACLPVFMAYTAMGVCQRQGVQRYRRSKSTSSQSRWKSKSPLVNHFGLGRPAFSILFDSLAT